MNEVKENETQYTIAGQLFEPGIHYRSNSWSFSKKVVSAEVTVESAKFCVKYPTARCVGNSVVVTAGFEVYHAGDYFSVKGKIVAALESADSIDGKAGEPAVTLKEVEFTMKADNSDHFPMQTMEMAGKVLDCHILNIEGNKGANFFIRREKTKGVLCSGGFRSDPASKYPLEAKVTAWVLMEKEETNNCYQAKCQTCHWTGGIYTNYQSAIADAESHTITYPTHIVNLYNVPC
jgi:hypothetical protein